MKSVVFLFGVLTTLTGLAGAGEVSYPHGYRHWTHVKTMLIQPGHALANPFAGIHHIYANQRAWHGLKNGDYADGSVFVFDLIQAREQDHSVTEGDRKLIGVMVRDRKRFAATGGWGFEGFAGDSKTRRLTHDAGRGCFACHEQKKDKGFVFTGLR